jgi:hypothetical protein
MGDKCLTRRVTVDGAGIDGLRMETIFKRRWDGKGRGAGRGGEGVKWNRISEGEGERHGGGRGRADAKIYLKMRFHVYHRCK